MSNEHRMVGPPGTGKTTALARQIAFEAEKRGSDAVIALSLTNAAAEELASRHVPLPRGNVGTLHSMAFRGLESPRLLQDEKGLAAFNETCKPYHTLGGQVRAESLELDDGGGSTDGDQLMAEYARLRNCMVPRDVWPPHVAGFAKEWEEFKRGEAGLDFTDMLEYAIHDLDAAPGDPQIIVADEFQDFSKLAMTLLWQWSKNAEILISGGDPDQSIFGFAGSRPETFTENPPARQHVLEQSYRVPRAVHKFAVDWISRNANREPIVYRPRDADGKVLHLPCTWRRPNRLWKCLEEDAAAGRTSMVLATCGYMLRPLIAMLKEAGVPFQNQFRPAEQVWNPLTYRRPSATMTVERLIAYLTPWLDNDTNGWTGGMVEKWMAMTQGLKGRGAKHIEDDQGNPISDDAMVTDDQLLTLIPHTAKALALIGGPPEGLAVIQEHLNAKYQKVAEYFFAVARRNGIRALVDPPLCTIGTGHSVKGGEADRVYIFPDLSAQGYQAWSLMVEGREAIRRLFYVMVTRARNEMVMMDASGTTAVHWGG